nr:androgen-induced gene 1 protein-like isoform X2 [Lytechinus pictus]
MDSAGKIFHALAFAYYCFSYYYYCEHVYYRVNASDFRPKSYQYGGDTKFLTMWCWMVVSMFWILWSIDRKLVFPKELDEFFPVWLNHVLHTNVLPILLVDMWLIRHKPPSKLRGVTTLSLFSALYMAWIFWLGYGVNIWVYPILRVLSGIKFVFFIVLCTTAPLPVYFLGEWCINVFHGPGERSKKVK